MKFCFIDVQQPDIDCSQYVDDNYIVDTFPFTVHLNPVTENSAMTFGSLINGKIVSLNMVNEECIPSLIYCFKHLSELRIVNTSFCDSKQGFPAHIEVFAASITNFIIEDTKITHIPNQISKLKRLERLKLSNTGLMSLPDSIGDLSALKFLSLPYNDLKSLPTTMKQLRLLEQITLTSNPHLNSIQTLNDLPSLNKLYAEYCSIESLPHNLPKLFALYMTNNSLTKLTGIETLGSGTNKRKLFDFDYNHIQSMSPQIRYVRNLYTLNLNHNKLNTLPTDIFSVTTLSYLYIKQNSFNDQDLKIIISKFRHTNPKLSISW